MTIASAILGTFPYLYYKLDESSGSIAHDSGTGLHNALLQFDYQLGVLGPEAGTTALRMFPSASITSTPLNLSGITDFTVQFYAAAAPTNSSVSAQLLQLGNPTTGGTGRGWSMSGIESGGVASWSIRWWPQVVSAVASCPQPTQFWHHIAVTWDFTTSTFVVYVDGTSVTTQVQSGTKGSILTTDSLLAVASQNYVLAHMAIHTHKLLSSEIASIGAFAQQWPYSVNTSQSVPTTDLTAVDAALATIDTEVNTLLTNWTNFQTVTLPSLNDVLSAIEAQITAVQTAVAGITFPDLSGLTGTLTSILDGLGTTITSAGGTVATTFTDLFKHFTIDSLTTNDLTGGETCDRVEINIGGGTFFGLVLDCTTVPDWYVATGPGDSYIMQDLAVLTIRRGTHLLLRRGVHELHTEIYPLPGIAPEFQSIVETLGLPPEYWVTVDWGTGVCGSLGALAFP